MKVKSSSKLWKCQTNRASQEQVSNINISNFISNHWTVHNIQVVTYFEPWLPNLHTSKTFSLWWWSGQGKGNIVIFYFKKHVGGWFDCYTFSWKRSEHFLLHSHNSQFILLHSHIRFMCENSYIQTSISSIWKDRLYLWHCAFFCFIDIEIFRMEQLKLWRT